MIIYWFLIILLWDHWLCRLKCCLLLIVQSLLLVAQPHISTALVVVGSTHSTHFACFFDVFFFSGCTHVQLCWRYLSLVYTVPGIFLFYTDQESLVVPCFSGAEQIVISMIFPSMFIGELRIFSDLFLVTFQHCVSSCQVCWLHHVTSNLNVIFQDCGLVLLAGWCFFLAICHNIAHQTRTPLTYQPTEVMETAQLTYVEVSIL